MKSEKLIIGEMPTSGPVNINVDYLAENWDDNCWLAEWRAGAEDDFRFIRYKKIGKEEITHKFTISREQAAELIKRLSLEASQGAFNSAFSWRKPGVTELSLLKKYKVK